MTPGTQDIQVESNEAYAQVRIIKLDYYIDLCNADYPTLDGKAKH